MEDSSTFIFFKCQEHCYLSRCRFYRAAKLMISYEIGLSNLFLSKQSFPDIFLFANVAHMLIYSSYLTNPENLFDQFLKYPTSSLRTAMPKGNNKNCLITVTPRWYINMFKQIKMPFPWFNYLSIYSQW